MRSTPLKSGHDFTPIPFEQKLCKLAQHLKESGLKWHPQVGCFVWDPEETISVPSPFPNHIYFILNLNHFLKIFASEDRMQEKLVWLPTWHQAREIGDRMKIHPNQISEKLINLDIWSSRQEIYSLYELILNKLKNS